MKYQLKNKMRGMVSIQSFGLNMVTEQKGEN